MRILVSDQNFGDGAELERRLAAEAGVDLEVEAVEAALELLRGERPSGIVAP